MVRRIRLNDQMSLLRHDLPCSQNKNTKIQNIKLQNNIRKYKHTKDAKNVQ